MERSGYKDLEAWASSPSRRPLVVRGARQVGKTWLVKSFATSCFEAVATLDFERDPKARQLFEDPSPLVNLRAVEAFLGQRVEPGHCLLFLDEIQAAPEVLGRLRYFHEEIPSLHVVAAGSLLDFALSEAEFSMPVGRISYLHLEPLSFSEFLMALGHGQLAKMLGSWEIGGPIANPVHEKLLGLVRDYMVAGGMPAAVEALRDSQSWVEVSRLHQDLLATFRDDFWKYSTRASGARLSKLLDAIPLQVGQKFKFSRVDRDDRAAPLRQALELLCKARVCHRVSRSHGNGVPLAAELEEKDFKVVLLDTGLLLAGQRFKPEQIADPNLVHEGSVTEHLAGQMLRTLEPSYMEPTLFYWRRSTKGSEAEVDYLFQHAGRVVPVEVKAGTTGSLRSLHLFMQAKALDLAVRVHGQQPELREIRPTGARAKSPYRLLSIPLYLVGELPRLLDACRQSGSCPPGKADSGAP